MTQTALESYSATPYARLLTFEYGQNRKRYARHTDDVVFPDRTYEALVTDEDETTSLAACTIDLGDQQGGTEDTAVEVTLPTPIEPVKYLAAGYAWAPTTVRIEECDPIDPQGTVRLLYVGQVETARANPDGRPNMTKLMLGGVKGAFNIPLGLAANTDCAWRFGDGNCQFPLVGEVETATITELNTTGDPRRIRATLSGGDLTDDRWSGGYFEVDGLKILIRRSNGAGIFDLSLIPPPTWEDADGEATPGCMKTPAQCAYWENTVNFGGMGVAMPGRNPTIHED